MNHVRFWMNLLLDRWEMNGGVNEQMNSKCSVKNMHRRYIERKSEPILKQVVSISKWAI